MKEFVMKPSRCPACAYKMDRASSVEHEHAPKEDDFTICINCGAWLQFNDDTSLRVASREAMESADPETKALFAKVEMAQRLTMPRSRN